MNLSWLEWFTLVAKLFFFAASLTFIVTFASLVWHNDFGKAGCFGVMAILCNDFRRGIK